ncbi:MAG: hypothetical protein JWN44_1948 [Myxococcales bacterium]|nr:hypothetical protein [Myxococcales bacterium]
MRAEANDEAFLDDNEPVGLLRANEAGHAERILPLFRRPARIVVGREAACDWRFERYEGAPLELSWDGVRLKVAGRKVKPDELVTTAGGVEIVFELMLFSEEVTQIRRMPLPPAGPTMTAEPEAKTVIEVRLPEPQAPQPQARVPQPQPVAAQPSPPLSTIASPLAAPRPADPVSPPRPWRCFVPPRNGAADDEPTVLWPGDDALRPTADLLDRLSRWSLRRLPRRKLALYAALAVVVVIEIALLLRPRKAPTGPSAQATSFTADAAAAAPVRAMQPDKDLEKILKEGIRAYRSGHTADAIDRFGRIDQATGDPAARLMLFVLRTRGAATP